MAIGYTQHGWERLRDDLVSLAQKGDVVAMEPGTYGQKYEVSGKLVGPNGRVASFKTIWLIESEASEPRF